MVEIGNTELAIKGLKALESLFRSHKWLTWRED